MPMKKRILSILLALVLTAGLLPSVALADDDYILLAETDQYAVYTKSVNPWTAGYLSYTSGNADDPAPNSLSSMKVVAKAAGLLTFDWAVSALKDYGYFAYRTSGEYTVYTDVTNQTEDIATGNKSGTADGIVVEVGGTVYLTYISVESYVSETRANTATISNITISAYDSGDGQQETGTGPVRGLSDNDGSFSYEAVAVIESTDQTGQTVYSYEYSPTTLDDMTSGNLYRVTATAAAGKQFYGWIRHYAYNGRTLTAFEGSDNGAITFRMNDTTYYTPVFASEGAYYARDGVNFYTRETTLQSIIDAAPNESVVVLMQDYSLTEDLTIPTRKTLYIPFRDSWGSEESAGSYYYSGEKGNCTKAIAGSDKVFCRLTIQDNITVTVNGTLVVGATLGYPEQRYQGHVSGPHGRITNNGTITVGSGGVFSCLGITEGSGSVYADDGATVRESLIIGDFAGGNNSADLYFENQMPFKRFSVQNIQCELRLEAQATLKVLANVWALSTYNPMDMTLFGTSNMSIIRSGGASNSLALTRTYDPSGSLTDGDGLLDVTGVGLTHWTFSSNMTFQPMSIDFGIKLDTGACDFSIPYNFDIMLSSGTYTIPNSVRLLPGARLTIGSNATAVITGRLTAMPGLVQSDMSGDRYPSRSELTAAGYAPYGRLIVNGVLIMQEWSTLAGFVDSSGGGTVKLAENVYLENRTASLSGLDVTKELRDHTPSDAWAVKTYSGGDVWQFTGVENWVMQDGARGYYDENTVWFNNPAKLFNGSELITPKAGLDYTSQAMDGSADVYDSYEGLYVPEKVLVKSGDNYVYSAGARTMEDGSYEFLRTVTAAWTASSVELEVTSSVAGSSTSGTTASGVELDILTRPSGTGTLIYSITPQKDGKEVTEKYVFLVQYTIDGSDTPLTVAETEDGWLIPAEANGATVQSALLGDVNVNGSIQGSDVRNLYRAFASSDYYSNLSDLMKLAADINGDGEIKGSEVRKLYKYFADPANNSL